MSKLKTNFATRVVALVTPKYQGDSGRNTELIKVLAATNAPETKVVLNPLIHAKTAEEKEELKQIKKDWRQSLDGKQWLAKYAKLSVKNTLKL